MIGILITALTVALFVGYFATQLRVERDNWAAACVEYSAEMDSNARRVRVLRDEVARLSLLLCSARDDNTLLTADLARAQMDRDSARHALVVQICPPGERMSLLGRGIVTRKVAL